MTRPSRYDQNHLYDWVVVHRALQGRLDLILRPLCGRELREVCSELQRRDWSRTAIADWLHIAHRDVDEALAAAPEKHAQRAA